MREQILKAKMEKKKNAAPPPPASKICVPDEFEEEDTYLDDEDVG